MPLTTAPLDELVAALKAEPHQLSAAVNPADVQLPGCWVALDSVAALTVGGRDQLAVSLYLISGDTDDLRALERLFPMLETVRSIIRPSGRVETIKVVLPTGSTPMPALRVPLNLTT